MLYLRRKDFDALVDAGVIDHETVARVRRGSTRWGSGGAGAAGADDGNGDLGGSAVRIVPVAVEAEEDEEDDADAVVSKIEAQQASEAQQQRHQQEEMQAAAHARLERRRSTQRALHAAADTPAAGGKGGNLTKVMPREP